MKNIKKIIYYAAFLLLAMLAKTSIPAQKISKGWFQGSFFNKKSSIPVESTLNYNGLLQDIARYITTNTNFHGGNLYEHSVWTALIIEKWFKEKHFWTEGLDTNQDKKIAIIAGLLHDIGKAGDHKYIYYDKPKHPQVGFEYLTGTKPYLLADGTQFNFVKWFTNLNLTQEDQKIAAIAAGIHWDFGGIIIRGRDAKKNNDMLAEKYLNRLQQLVSATNYNNGTVDEKILKLSLLISTADVHATRKTDFASELFPEVVADNPHYYDAKVSIVLPGAHKYQQFQLETKGKKAREHLLDYFRQNNAQTTNVKIKSKL